MITSNVARSISGVGRARLHWLGLRLLVGLTAAILTGAAWALVMPSIAVVSPGDGSVVGPTALIRVAYSGEGLDPSTFRIDVRGEDWTPRFSVSATEATYQPTSDQPLIAGPMAIEASVSTLSQESASTSASFSVAATLVAVSPDEGRVGDLVEIIAVGLDPLPAKNAVVMLRAGASPPNIVAAFEEVAPDGKSGKVRIPRGARSGPLSIRVNGIDSPETLPFFVKTVVPKCGNLEDFDFAANGDIFAVYTQPDTVLRDPLCPAPLIPGAPSYALIIHENGAMDRVIEGTSAVAIMGSVVDKSGRIGAFVTRTRLDTGSYQWRVKWWKDGDLQVSVLLSGLNSAFTGCCTFNFPLDFDQENRLYLMAQNRLARVTIPVNDDLPDEPEVTRPIEFIGPTYGFEAVFAIDCDNKAYVAHHHDLNTPPNYIGYNLTQVDLRTGAGTAIEGADQRWALDMDVSCSAGKVYVSQFTSAYGILDVEVVEVGQASTSILGGMTDVSDNPLLKIGPQGELLMTVGDFEAGYKYRPGGGRTVVALDAEPIAGCDSSGPLAFCTRVVDKLEILPTTTRWKPQRSDAPMKIVFSGPAGLDLSTVRLEVVAPGGEAAGYVPTLGPAALAAGKTNEYEAEWLKPWTYPVQTATGIEQVRLPRGNYTLRVKGRKLASSLELTSPDYSKASLVAITGVLLQSNVSSLDVNPNVGGGKRIFPEATQPAPNDQIDDRDLVEVVVQTSPAIAAGPHPPVTVAIRAIDVDDPSAMDDDVDLESGLLDNRGDEEIGVGLFDPNQAGAVTPVGSILTASVGQTGEATAFLRVSKRQGDNYRLAVALDPIDLLGCVPTLRSSTGEVRMSSGLAAPVGLAVTEMLTVWRTLHLEVDSLDSSRLLQSRPESTDSAIILDLQARASSVEARKLVDAAAPFVVPAPRGGLLVDHSRNDDWAWADLILTGQGSTSVKVVGNNKSSISVAAGTDLRLHFEAGDPFTVRDDVWQPLGELPVGFSASLLAKAYIQAEALAEAVNRRRTHPMRRNLDAATLSRLPKDVESSAAFWSVMLVDAFDPDTASDNDPSDPSVENGERRNERATFGETVGRVPLPLPGGNVSGLIGQDDSQPICSVYRETLRDGGEEDSWTPGPLSPVESTLAHELVCHAMALGHAPGTLCNSSPLEGAPGTVLPAKLVAHLRGLPAPRSCPQDALCPYR